MHLTSSRLPAAADESQECRVVSACQELLCTTLNALQVVLEAHFVFRYTAGSGDGQGGQLSSAGVSLVLGNASMPAGGAALVLDTQFSVSWINSSAPASALQVGNRPAIVWYSSSQVLLHCAIPLSLWLPGTALAATSKLLTPGV
jgi:hypothetical protein